MRVFDLLLRVCGAVLSVLMAAGSALLESMATPGFWIYPVTAAIVGNAFLVWFTRSTVDRSWAPWIPAVAWSVMMFAMMGGTSEGDQIANSFTGLATFAAGGFTFVIVAMLLSRPENRPVQLKRPGTPV